MRELAAAEASSTKRRDLAGAARARAVFMSTPSRASGGLRVALLLPVTILAVASAVWGVSAQNVTPPGRPNSVKFAVLGDNGTGDRPQMDVAQQMVSLHDTVPFDMVFMVGDNMRGGQSPRDFVTKFETPYGPLLEEGVQFYAVLGNHDSARIDRAYKRWNMGGQRYYTVASKNVRFFVLDTNDPDPLQLSWLDGALRDAKEDWKVCFFHNPLYSNARTHGSDTYLRAVLEPILVKYGVNMVFSGHDHVYERIAPQQGVTYFVSGSGGELRKGDVRPAANTAAYFDQDQSFVVVEIDGDDLYFEAISRTGMIVDSGVIHLHPRTFRLTSRRSSPGVEPTRSGIPQTRFGELGAPPA
jgi:predicted MPP superfamily phosphohydrolase